MLFAVASLNKKAVGAFCPIYDYLDIIDNI
jgi:hypothetical protein